jgi:hypothetical protein
MVPWLSLDPMDGQRSQADLLIGQIKRILRLNPIRLIA